MSFIALARSLNLLKINGFTNVTKCLSTNCLASSIKCPKLPLLLNLKTQEISPSTTQLEQQFTNLNINNQWIYREEQEISNPLIQNSVVFPNGLLWVPPEDHGQDENAITPKSIIEAPAHENNVEKHAARLIIIRRKKMKKHKLRKLRKRMKFEWAKVRQRRELRKEKAFQAVLIAQCKEAEAFDAQKYVQERLDKLHEIIIPKYWKGKRLPEFLIREKMGLPPK